MNDAQEWEEYSRRIADYIQWQGGRYGGAHLPYQEYGRLQTPKQLKASDHPDASFTEDDKALLKSMGVAL